MSILVKKSKKGEPVLVHLNSNKSYSNLSVKEKDRFNKSLDKLIKTAENIIKDDSNW